MSGTPPATLPGGIGPQGMPNLAVPMVNQDGTVAFAWYQFFVSLFKAVLVGLQNPSGGTNNPMTVAQLTAQVNAQAAQIAQLQSDVAALQGSMSSATFDGQTASALQGAGQPVPVTVSTYLIVNLQGDPTNYAIPLFLAFP